MNMKKAAFLAVAPLLFALPGCSDDSATEDTSSLYVAAWSAAHSALAETDGDVSQVQGIEKDGFMFQEVAATKTGVKFCGVSADGIYAVYQTNDADGIVKVHLANTPCPYLVEDAHVVGSWSEIQGGAWSKGAHLMGETEVLPGTVAIGAEAIAYATSLTTYVADHGGTPPTTPEAVSHSFPDNVSIGDYTVDGSRFRVCVKDSDGLKYAWYDSLRGDRGIEVTQVATLDDLCEKKKADR